MAVVALAPVIGVVEAAPPPPVGPVSVFAHSPRLAVDAARIRLGLYLRDNPADSPPADCPIMPADAFSTVSASVGSSAGTDLRLQLEPWLATTRVEPELRPSSVPAGVPGGLSVVTCATDRPADGALTRPTLSALALRGGVSFDDVARRYGVEPILRVRPAGIGGELAGSCQSTPSTGVCVALWQSRRLVVGMTLEGPASTVSPSLPGRMATAAIPPLLDSMAVRVQAAPTCSAAALTAETGVALVSEPACRDGWALGISAPCPSTGCTEFEVFHAESSGWQADGLTDVTCAENLAVLGMTGVTAQKFTGACNPRSRVLRSGAIRPGHEGQRVFALQVALVNLGYDLPVDGRYGPLTQAAVVHYQMSNGLIVDGVTGAQTRGSLGI